jgi:hypothetical protein
MCHKFFFREAAAGPAPASDFDFFDFDDRQFLPVPDGLMIAFAAFHLERELFFAALVFHHVGDYARTRDRRPADGDFIAADHEHTVKCKWFARLDIKAFDFERVARDDTILFAASFQDCVHKFSRKGLDIKPDFCRLSTPEIKKNRPCRDGAARCPAAFSGITTVVRAILPDSARWANGDSSARHPCPMQKNHEKPSKPVYVNAKEVG